MYTLQNDCVIKWIQLKKLIDILKINQNFKNLLELKKFIKIEKIYMISKKNMKMNASTETGVQFPIWAKLIAL